LLSLLLPNCLLLSFFAWFAFCLNNRNNVLRELQALAEDWVKQVCIDKGKPTKIAEEAGGAVTAFGSYRLGVNDQCESGATAAVAATQLFAANSPLRIVSTLFTSFSSRKFTHCQLAVTTECLF
jgi:poly(A) polymerase Pap1